jgi:hypothetical protein
MKFILITILLSSLFNISVAVEEKCTWNIIKSNCKFQKISDNLGIKTDKGINRLKPITNIFKKKTSN